MSPVQQITLVGLSGVGKTAVGREMAEQLAWPLIDTDRLIEENVGESPARIILDRGEQAFREIEVKAIKQATGVTPAVIATGGGAFLRAKSRELLGARGLLCFLDAPPPEIARRLREAPQTSERPLLGDDTEGQLYRLDAERRPFYSHADLWVPTLGLTPPQVARRILESWGGEAERLVRAPHRMERLGADAPARAPQAIVDTGRDRYPIWVSRGELQRLPERLQQLGLTGKLFLVSDSAVMEAHGSTVAESLDAAGLAGASYVVPAGEGSKQLSVAHELYRWLAAERAERNDVIVALGGGVVGDLAGYVAATYLRGMPLVQVPTSLLAMTDAAIGGKVAVDLPAGKNLVGAFHQPSLVIADVETLSTLPRRALIEGFAEVIKHALILDPGLLELLDTYSTSLTSAAPDLDQLNSVVTRSARLKAMVVSADPLERGTRAILNYGHTIGHALETVTGYEQFLHGEAVSVGMMGAARIAARMDLLSEDAVARQADLLRSFGLPLTASGVDATQVLETMKLDKKRTAGQARFILLERFGQAVVRNDVPEGLVEEVVRGLVTS